MTQDLLGIPHARYIVKEYARQLWFSERHLDYRNQEKISIITTHESRGSEATKQKYKTPIKLQNNLPSTNTACYPSNLQMTATGIIQVAQDEKGNHILNQLPRVTYKAPPFCPWGGGGGLITLM